MTFHKTIFLLSFCIGMITDQRFYIKYRPTILDFAKIIYFKASNIWIIVINWFWFLACQYADPQVRSSSTKNMSINHGRYKVQLYHTWCFWLLKSICNKSYSIVTLHASYYHPLIKAMQLITCNKDNIYMTNIAVLHTYYDHRYFDV